MGTGRRQVIGRRPIGASFTDAEKLASMFGIFPDGFANGGIVKGGFQSYANGGIVNQPTVGLVGEGRFNEAVVPLPNGKAIPVDMKGSGGVTVNVAVNNNGSATTSVEGAQQQSANFGKAIAMAVQKEIQNQKRSGGMLSPYGAA
jgi:phage-related minor tail protein